MHMARLDKKRDRHTWLATDESLRLGPTASLLSQLVGLCESTVVNTYK